MSFEVVTVGGATTNTNDYFQYSALPPLIISMSPTSGGPSSNPAVGQTTITGKNFLTGSGNTTVSFYPVSDWNGTTDTMSGSGLSASVSVTSPTALTVTLPNGMTKNTVYYPYISLPAYSLSSQPYNEQADQFTYTG